MERKRTGLRITCEEEEDKEEDWDRTIILRNIKRVKYVKDDEEEEEEEDEDEDEEDDDEEDRDRRISPRNRKRKRDKYIEDDDDEEDEEEDEEVQEDNEQPGPSTHNTHKKRTQENGLLPVTCGNKKGILDVEKLDRGEACIKCEGNWLFPPEFEEFGGKGCSKKWKTSIFYENKPLQFLFEQGYLTTKGFKRRRTETTKQKKMLSSKRISESSSEESEIQSAEETKEDDVKDDDWLPGSEELALETEEGEEEGVGAENGGEVVDSGVDKSKEEEDKMEKGEMEDEDMPAVADNDKDNSVSEEREAKLIILTSEKIRDIALQKKVRVIIERLPEFQVKSHCQSKCMEHPVVDSLCKPLDEDSQNEEERENSGSAIDDPSITAATHFDSSQMSDPPIIGGAEKENGEEFTQSNERKEDGQREIKTEKNSPTPVSAPATSTPHIKPVILNETEDIGSSSNHTVNLRTVPVLLVTVTDTNFAGDMIDEWEEREERGHCGEEEKDRKRSEMGLEMQRRWIKGFEDEHLDTSNTSPIQRGVKEESIEAMSGPTESLSVLVECKYENTDATTSGHDAAQLQVMNIETRAPQTTQASDSTQSSDMVEAPSSRPSTSSNLDTMDLDQLRREKIKMQLKVLKLQEEYYTQKIQEHKK